MLRRDFLRNASLAMAGAVFGLGTLSPVFGAEPDPSPADPQPRIALIIDDIGYSRRGARRFLDLEIPLTFAVLPRLPKSRALALEIHERGHELMLHQPMEPYDAGINPGPGALYVGNPPGKITDVIAENLAEIPHATGVNNHMGSRFTSSPHDMEAALSAVASRGLFFVDSLTAGSSVAYRTARRMSVAAARRNIFLDPVVDTATVTRQLLRLKRHALTRGHAVGIGHPHGETAEAIRRFIADPANGDLRLTPVSRLLTAA